MISKKALLARIFLCTALIACTMVPYGGALAASQTGSTGTRPVGEAENGTRAPLEMRVDAAGRPESGMELRVTVKSRFTSAKGEINVHSPDGSLAPSAGGAAPGLWKRSVEATRSADVQEVFQVAPAIREGAMLVVEFVSDGRPRYYAKIGYTLTLRSGVGKAEGRGGLTPVVEMIEYPMADGEESAMAAETEGAADGSAEVTPSCAECTTIKGQLYFTGPQGTTEAPWEAKVEAWDHDVPESSDDYLGAGYVDRFGNFQITFTNGADEFGTSADVYLKIKSDSLKHKVVNPGRQVYEYRTGETWWDLPRNATYDMGRIKMNVAGDAQKAFFIYRWMSQGWHYVKNNFGSVPTDHAYAIVPSDNLGNSLVDWGHGANSAHFVPPPPWGSGSGYGEIHFGSNTVTGSIITHEYGHYAMYRLNGDRFRWWDPAILYGTHYIDEPMRTKAGAWIEGWADYFSAASRGNSRFYWNATTWIDFENWTCTAADDCNPNGGDYVEGRIAATLWDLIDSTADGETSQHAHATIIDVFDEEVLVDFYDFFLMWVNKAHSCEEFVRVASQNTINYQCGGEHASFGDWSVPDKMDAGKLYPVWVMMLNDGAWPWREMGRVRLGSQNPENNMVWGLNRVRLDPDETVDPGEYHTFVFNARAPSIPGFYPFQWKMVRDGFFWFGTPTPSKLIQVVCEAPPAVGAGTYDNSSSSVRYCGPWSYQSGATYARAHQSTLHVTDVDRATAAFRFNGSRLSYRFSMAPNRGPVNVFIDGNFMGTLTPRADEIRRQAAKSWDLAYGTHIVEVRAAGGTGSFVDLDAFQVDAPVYSYPTVYDSESSALTYVGTWGGATSPTRRWSNVTGDTMTFNFYGNSIVYSHTLAANRGMAAVTIDGVDKGLVDLYAPSTQYGRSTTYTNLGPGPHTITITVSGKRNAAATDQFVDVDSLQPVR